MVRKYAGSYRCNVKSCLVSAESMDADLDMGIWVGPQHTSPVVGFRTAASMDKVDRFPWQRRTSNSSSITEWLRRSR